MVNITLVLSIIAISIVKNNLISDVQGQQFFPILAVSVTRTFQRVVIIDELIIYIVPFLKTNNNLTLNAEFCLQEMRIK